MERAICSIEVAVCSTAVARLSDIPPTSSIEAAISFMEADVSSAAELSSSAFLETDAMDRLIPDVPGDGVARADVVIEAIFENVDAKRALFADVEARARPDAILATNTSSIPLEDIAGALRSPARLIGLHFFNPVARMMLVEVVAGRDTADNDSASA